MWHEIFIDASIGATENSAIDPVAQGFGSKNVDIRIATVVEIAELSVDAIFRQIARTTAFPEGSRNSGPAAVSCGCCPAAAMRAAVVSRSSALGRTIVQWRSVAVPGGAAGAPALSQMLPPRWWW